MIWLVLCQVIKYSREIIILMGFSLIQAIGHARRAVPSSRHLGSGTQRYGKDDLVASTFTPSRAASNGDYYAGEGLKEFVRLVAEKRAMEYHSN